MYVCIYIYRNTVGFLPEIATKVISSWLTQGNGLKVIQEMKIMSEVHWYFGYSVLRKYSN